MRTKARSADQSRSPRGERLGVAVRGVGAVDVVAVPGPRESHSCISASTTSVLRGWSHGRDHDRARHPPRARLPADQRAGTDHRAAAATQRLRQRLRRVCWRRCVLLADLAHHLRPYRPPRGPVRRRAERPLRSTMSPRLAGDITHVGSSGARVAVRSMHVARPRVCWCPIATARSHAHGADDRQLP